MNERRSSLTGRDVTAAWLICLLIGGASLAAMSTLGPEMPPAAIMTNSICRSPPVSACLPSPELSANPDAQAALHRSAPMPHFGTPRHG